MLVYTVPEYEKDVINISKDDCYMHGVLLGGGYMHNTQQNAMELKDLLVLMVQMARCFHILYALPPTFA